MLFEASCDRPEMSEFAEEPFDETLSSVRPHVEFWDIDLFGRGLRLASAPPACDRTLGKLQQSLTAEFRANSRLFRAGKGDAGPEMGVVVDPYRAALHARGYL